MFSFANKKSNSNFAVNLAKMLKEATIHCFLFDESHFSNIYTLNYVTVSYTEINCVNIGKSSNTVFPVSIFRHDLNKINLFEYC